MEKLFVQIFERKKWIIEKLKYQRQVYYQNLAFELLIQGITPPPWLFGSSDLPSSSSNFDVTNKEKLLSGLLFPHPRTAVSHSKGPFSLLNTPIASAAYTGLPDGSCVSKCANIKGSAENGVGVLPPCQVHNIAGAPNLVTVSPYHQTVTMKSDTHVKPDQSLVRIQRYRSRQKALELRNSTKASGKSCLGNESDAGARYGITTCRDAEHLNAKKAFADPIELPTFSIEDCITKEKAIHNCLSEDRRSDVYYDSLPRSRSSVMKKVEMGDEKNMEKRSEIYSGVVTRSRSRCPQSVGDHGLCEKRYETYCEETTRFTDSEAKHVVNDLHKSQVKADNVYSARATRSRSSFPQHDGRGCYEDQNHIEFCIGGTTRSKSGAAGQAKTEDNKSRDIDQSTEQQNEYCSGRLTTSRSCQQFVGDHGAKQVENDSHRSIRKAENVYSGRVTRSRSSCQHHVGGSHCAGEKHNEICCSTITRSKSYEDKQSETEYQRSSNGAKRSRNIGMFLKQSQDDFNDAVVTCLPNFCSATCRSGPEKSVGDALLASVVDQFHPHDWHVKLNSAIGDFLLVQQEIPRKKVGTSGVSTAKREDDALGNSGNKAYKDEENFGCTLRNISAVWRTSEAVSPDKVPPQFQHGKFKSLSGKSLSPEQCSPIVDKKASEDSLGKEMAALSKLGNSAYGDGGNSGVVSLHASSAVSTSEALVKPLGARNSDVSECKLDYTLPKCDESSEQTSLSKNYSACLQAYQEDVYGSPAEDAGDPQLDTSEASKFSFQSMCVSKERQNLSEGEADCCLLNIDVDPVMSVPSQKHNKVESKQRATVCSEEAEINPSFSGDCKLSRNPHMAKVAQSSRCRNSDRSSRISSVTITGDDSKCKHAVKKTGSDGSCLKEELYISYVDAHSEVPSVHPTFIMHPDHSICSPGMGSWPRYKQRKVDCQTLHKSASPSLRTKPLVDAYEDAPNAFLSRVKNHSSAFSLCLSTSNELDAGNSSSNLTAVGTDQNINLPTSNDQKSSALMKQEKDDVSLGAGIRVMIHSPNKHEKSASSGASNLMCRMIEERKGFVSEAGEVRTDVEPDSRSWLDSLVHNEDEADANDGGKFISTQTVMDQGISMQKEDSTNCSFGYPLMDIMDVASSDQTMPEFEGFIIGDNRESTRIYGDGDLLDKTDLSNNTIKRASFLGQPCKSASRVTSYPSVYKLHLKPDIYQAVPNELLEHVHPESTLLDSDDTGLQLKDTYIPINEANYTLLEKSRSDCLPLSSARLGWDTTRPCTSSISKKFEAIISKSGGSSKQGSCNSELTCFTIEEDPESDEENLNMEDAAKTSEKEVDSKMQNSSMRKPLHDLAAGYVSTLASHHATERSSLVSVATEISATEISNRGNQKIRVHQSGNIRTGPVKENQSFSVGANSMKKPSYLHSSRVSRPGFSEKTSLGCRRQSLLDKEHKRNDIVCNMNSFLPTVQQKQPAALVSGKRDVRVKALEAAEAARRLAAKRENERKQKKEALKLQRARLEQENLRQIELQKKIKEEERKKRDAENAARKRRREEEERKEKDRKRMRLEEARKQRREQEEKMHVERELRIGPEDERTNPGRKSDDKREKQVDRGKEGDNFSRKPAMEMVQEGVLPKETGNHHKACSGFSDAELAGDVAIMGTQTPNYDKDKEPIEQIIQEQSYEISPYQCSDDEGEEDVLQIKKFVPTWASKKAVAQALSFLHKLDPDVIFPLGSFCSLDEGNRE